MDTFIDKLAQKFTAQEMIKANAAADAEELKRLEAQAKEYQSYLKRMEELCQLMEDTAEEACRQMEDTANKACRQLEKTSEEARIKLEEAAVNEGEIDRVVEAGLTKIRQIQHEGGRLDDLRQELEEIRARQCTVENMDEVARGVQEISQRLQDMPQGDRIGAVLDEKLEASGETIHKECVKVYRNVQAVISEESTKITDSFGENMKGFAKNMKGIMGISFAALVFSLIGVVFQMLTWLNII